MIKMDLISDGIQDIGVSALVNKLVVNVMRSTDNQGYIIDLINKDTEELFETFTVWDTDFEE